MGECGVNKQSSIISVVGAGFQGKGKYYVLGSKPALIINHPLSINKSRKVWSEELGVESAELRVSEQLAVISEQLTI